MSQTNEKSNSWSTTPWLGDSAAVQLGLWQATVEWSSLTGWFPQASPSVINVANSPPTDAKPGVPEQDWQS